MAIKDKNLKSEIASYLGIDASWINKYSIVTMLFIVWLMFFDKYNFFANQRLQSTIHKLEENKAINEKEIKQTLVDIEDLKNNEEKFAREKYLMHKSDEEVIIIENNKK